VGIQREKEEDRGFEQRRDPKVGGLREEVRLERGTKMQKHERRREGKGARWVKR
jgi:hypothetical protein